MSIIMTDDELFRIREAREENSQLGELWRALKARTYKNTREDTLKQSSDTQMWWHLSWERIRDAASVYKIEPDKELGAWIYRRITEIIHMPVDSILESVVDFCFNGRGLRKYDLGNKE